MNLCGGLINNEVFFESCRKRETQKRKQNQMWRKNVISDSILEQAEYGEKTQGSYEIKNSDFTLPGIGLNHLTFGTCPIVKLMF